MVVKKSAIKNPANKNKKVTSDGDDGKAIDEFRTFTESTLDDVGDAPTTPPRTMVLDPGSNAEPQLSLFGTPSPEYKSLFWKATDQDFVRYTGNYNRKSIITEISRIDVTLFREGGHFYHQAGYRVEQKGEYWCTTGALPLSSIIFYLLNEAGAIIVRLTLALRIFRQNPVDTGPKLIITKIPTPEEVVEQTFSVWAVMPQSFPVGWSIP